MRVTEFEHAPALPADCEPYLIRRGQPAPDFSRLISGVRYGTTGFSVQHCGTIEIREKLRQHACRSGADTVRLVRESAPQPLLPCYRVAAELYLVGRPPAQGTYEVLVPRPEYRDD